MFRVFFFQPFKHLVYRGLKFRVVLAGFAGVYHFKKRGEIHFIVRRFVPDIANEGRIQQAFRFYPKIFRALFALALGVADQRVYQLQNVLFGMDVAKRVVAHTLGKVNGIQHFYPVAAPHKELAHFANQTSFRVSNHE